VTLRRIAGSSAVWLAASLFMLPAVATAADAPLVILLSWDGVRHDYPDLGGLPGLERVSRYGARAERLVPGWPSNTFPGHVSIATGAWANRHGIVDNQFWDRERGAYSYEADASWLEAEPIWIAAERQGLETGTFFWVGSETDWRGRRATYRISPFDPSIGEGIKVDQIFNWIDRPPDERPSLIMTYWRGVDSVAHDNGPDDAAVHEALKEQDGHLQRLLAGVDERQLWGVTTLLIVSDHGMTEVNEFFDVRSVLEQLALAGRVAGGGSVKHIFLADHSRARTLCNTLNEHPGIRAYLADEVPDEMFLSHPARTGDVVVVAEPPWVLTSPPWYQRALFHVLNACCDVARGSHGYDPALPDMGGVFLALGRGVPSGERIPAVAQVDVAPTVARLLGIEPPHDSIGTAIPAIGANFVLPSKPEPAAIH